MAFGRKNILFAMTGACGVHGGIATANLNVLRALVKVAEERGVGLTVFSLLESEADRPDFVPNWVDFRAFGGNQKLFSLALFREAIRTALFCFDHVSLALPVLPLAAARVVKTVIFAHGSEAWKSVERANGLSIRFAARCLTNSQYTLRKMRERLPAFNGAACPLGLSPEIPLNTKVGNGAPAAISLKAVDGRDYGLGSRVLLMVARMHPTEGQKGHSALINVMPRLLELYPDVQVVFAGPGSDRHKLEELAQAKGVASGVFFTGYVPVELLRQLYSYCYAFVMPSRQEGFGLAYLEAMNYAKPCVGCFDQGAEDIILDGETGLLIYDPNDQQELLGALDKLLADPERARAYGVRGFERLRQHFTSEGYQGRIKEEISQVL